jgi:hypothetical protein
LGKDTFLRILIGSFLFYDHVDPNGAFIKESMINVSVQVVKENAASQTDQYMNILKFSSLHFNSESTPKAVKQLFA